MNVEALQNAGVKIFDNASLSQYTTFRLGGTCPRLFDCRNAAQVEQTASALWKAGHPFIVIGAGSNLLVSDEGVDCAVVRYVVEKAQIRQEGCRLFVSGGTQWDDVVECAAQKGLRGMTFASGIPGTVAGAVVGNAGAYGQQAGDNLESVEVLGPGPEKKILRKEDLTFSYRHSALKERTGWIILNVAFRLAPGNADDLRKQREEILFSRRHFDLKNFPSAGSFFKNIEATSTADRRQAAGWYLEQVGAKNFTCGGAAVFQGHANIIYKKEPDCTAADVLTLSQKMARAVEEKFNLTLLREVRLVGNFPNAHKPVHNPFH